MIFRASNGTEILDKIEIDEEEALIQYPSINHALVIVKCEDDYLLGYHNWRDDWETFEYGGLYGFVIEKEMLEIIDQCRKDKDEIGKIALLSELKRRREKIDEINEALLRYF